MAEKTQIIKVCYLSASKCLEISTGTKTLRMGPLDIDDVLLLAHAIVKCTEEEYRVNA